MLNVSVVADMRVCVSYITLLLFLSKECSMNLITFKLYHLLYTSPQSLLWDTVEIAYCIFRYKWDVFISQVC